VSPRHGVGVYGKNPTASVGRRFCNSIATWRPLWGYVVQVAPWVERHVWRGRRTFLGGLCAAACIDLADILTAELGAGTITMHSASNDAFSIEDIARFCDFLSACGGFEMG
jgi:hypothetical protein